MGGWEGGREGETEEWREGGREGGMETAREGGREGERERESARARDRHTLVSTPILYAHACTYTPVCTRIHIHTHTHSDAYEYTCIYQSANIPHLLRRKSPTIEAKETYYRSKRDLLQRQKSPMYMSTLLHPPPHTQEDEDDIARLAKEDVERLAKEASFVPSHI